MRAAVVATALLVVGAEQALAAPPANDNLASAEVIPAAGGLVRGNSGQATLEAGERRHGNGNARRTVWYAWTAPNSGPARIVLAGSGFDTTMAVYTGGSTHASLNLVDENDDSPYYPERYWSEVIWDADVGVTYKSCCRAKRSRSVRRTPGRPPRDPRCASR